MRKYIICICLALCLVFHMNGQDLTRRIIDSTKNELKTAKGNKKIDCLNFLAEVYYDLWDENDKHLDTACTYTEEAYKLAKNSGYKEGLGYALLCKAQCFGGKVDDNRNNNNTEANYSETEKYAKLAIQVGEEIKNYRLIGEVYDMLKWLERWKGDPVKFKNNVEKAIYYYEKPMSKKMTGHLGISECDQCQGNEGRLGWLYMLLSNLQGGSISARQLMIEKAISYYQKTSDKSGLSGAYIALGISFLPYNNIENSLSNFNKALALSREAGNEYNEAQAYTNICSALFNLGDFEKGIEYSKKSVAWAEKLARKNGWLKEKNNYLYQAYYWMGRFYSIVDDMETAFMYLRKAQFYSPNIADTRNCLTAIAEFHRSIGNNDSAMHYLSFTINNEIGIGKRILSTVYNSMKQYDKALEIINNRLKIDNMGTDLVNLGKTYTNAAKAYYGKNDYASALRNARQGLSLLKITSRNFSLVENYQLLSHIFNKMEQHDSAYFYLKQYTEAKDLLLKKQLYIKLNDYKKEAEEAKRIGQINLLQKNKLIREQELQQQILLKEKSEAQLSLLDKSNEIKDQKIKEQTLIKEQNQAQLTLLDKENKLKDQRLKQQAIIRNALLGGLLLFILLGVFVFRSLSFKRKNEKLAIEKRQAELQQKVTELEMQALRAQMNPHFIFNCLSSINKFILKNDTDAASDYLTSFSRLIRMSLTNSQLSLIPLSDEIEMLRLYLDMERLRFSDSFDYNIIYGNTIEPESIYIPPMLLQPFCENAIWHGLMHKQGQGKLEVMMSIRDNQLQCIITDNGIGREKAAGLKTKSGTKQKSFGLKITTERLALFNNEKEVHSFYRAEDVLDAEGNVAGTKVILNIKLKNTADQPVKETI